MAAVARGRRAEPGASADGGGAFADALAALVADEKDRLRRSLAAGTAAVDGGVPDVAPALAEVRFELAELRGRVESLQASVDAVAARLGADPPARDGA